MATLRGAGSGRVGRGVFGVVAKTQGGHDWLVWAPAEWRGAVGRTRTAEVVFPRMDGPLKILAENASMRWTLRKWRAHALFSMGDTGMIRSPVPHLLLVQQAYLTYGPSERGFRVPKRWELKMRAIEAYLRAALPWIDHFTVQTEHMKMRLSGRFGIDPERITVVPSAVPRAQVRGSSQRAGRPYLSYVASAGPHKNHSVLAPMMAGLRKSWPDLRCKLTVRCDEVPDLVRLARRLGCLDAFQFLGPIAHDEALGLIRGSVAFVMPSWLESFGLPYFEAMAAGTPVVASNLECAREACGEAALYADPRSGEEFAACVDRLLQSPELAAEMRHRALARYRDVALSWEEVTRRYVCLVEGLAR